MISIGLYLLLVSTQFVFPSLSYRGEFDDNGQQSLDDPLSKYWGISDTDTSVGRLFQCTIPPERDAFKGTIVEYDVEGEQPNTLPKWLIFDKKRSMLEGVPTIEDIGDTRINVKAYDSKGKFVSDMFIIEVYPLENDNTDKKKKCRNGEGVMMLAILIDEDLRNITPSHRISIIRTLAQTLSIPASSILLLPQFPSDYSSDVVQSNDKYLETNANSSMLVWQVGCDDRIWAEQLEVVSSVKKSVKSEALAGTLKLRISDWRLTTNSYPFRIRRHIEDDPVALDDTADENDDDDLEGGEEDEDDIKPSLSSSLQNSLSSASVKNDTSFSPQPSHEENNSTEPPSLEGTHSEHTPALHPSTDGEDDDGETDSPPSISDDGMFDLSNDTVSRSPTLIPCAACESTGNGSRTENTSAEPPPTITRFPPRLMKNLGPFVLKAGQPYSEKIPEDTFIDEGGDGNTSNLSLRIVQPDECKPERLWITLDKQTQTLWMLGSSDAVANYDIILEATNSANLSSNVSVKISVQYSPEERLINFEISLQLSHIDKNEVFNTSLLKRVLETISKLNGDTNMDQIRLRHVTCNPLIVTWTNSTLPLDSCDSATIRKLLSVLIEGEQSVKVNSHVLHYFDTLITVEKVTWEGKGECEGVLPKAENGVSNYFPAKHRYIGNLTARVGELFVYQIPENAFRDADVNSIRENKMAVTLSGQNTLPPDSWLQFDEKNQEIYGLPMNTDQGSTEYTVVLYDNRETDNELRAARQTVEIKVEPALPINYNVEFSMTLNSSYVSYEEFNRAPMLRRTLVKKLSELFGDEDTSSIVVSGYAPGSLIVIWHNKTLPVNTCPEKEIEKLRKVILTDKGELTERVNSVLGPEFQAVSAMLAPIGICEGGLTNTHPPDSPLNRTSPEEAIFSVPSFEYYLREYFVEIIMPIIIILFMMIFAGIVACFLYRRRRGTKWHLHNGTEKRTSRNRGIPVIFQDELEERLETSNKNPIIMKEEKPPLPPPEYQRTLPMATTALLSDFDDPSYHQEGSSYSPRTTDRREREKSGTPTYRKPPPYIPP